MAFVDPEDTWFQSLAKREDVLNWIAEEYRPTQANAVAELVWKEAVFANASQLVETLRRRGRVNMIRLFLSMEVLVEAVLALRMSDLANEDQVTQDYFETWKITLARSLTSVTQHLANEVAKTFTQN